MRKKVWIWNHYATNTYFDQGGRHYNFAKFLAEAGYEPVIFCAATIHNSSRQVDTGGALWTEKPDSVCPYVFVKTRPYAGNGKQRVLNMVDFYRGVKKVALEYANVHGKPDIIYASSVHPLTLVAGIQMARHFGVKCICEVRDSRRQGRIKRHNIWSSTIASAITIGFGGSVGAEAPIVLTGSAIGSNLGSVFKMEHRTLMLLVGCGAAGAIAGIFKAPIAGLVFTLEVLMIDLTMSSLLPLLISAVTAATVSYITTGTEAMFKFHLDQAFELERIPFVILLGIFCGLISLYFTRAMNSVEGVFGKLNNPYKKLAFGGVMLSVLIFLFPPLYGEGYDTINLLLNGTSAAEWDTVMNNSMFYGYGNLLLVYLMLIILLKVFASSATNGGGGCGGIFAPSLYLGCIAGFVFSHFSNDLAFSAYLPEKNFALMGMAGVMSGVMHAPLTGVFLIAELTGGYDLFLPLMIVSVSSYLTIIAFEPHSIYSMRLAKKGQLLTHHKDKAVLTLMKMENVVEKDFVVVHPEMDLGELVKAIAASHRNVFPVTDKKTGELLGVVLLDDIRNIMFRQELYHRFTVNKLMTSDRKSTRLNSSHVALSRMPSSA